MAPHSSTLAWYAAAHGFAKSWTRLSNFTFTFHFHALEKEMATHSSILAWRIPWTTEELHKKVLHDSDNHDGVITHLEPDILECEVKRALESIIRTKLVEVKEFQWSYLKSWKMMLWKCCIQYASKFGKLSGGHRTGKGQFSFQSQRKAMPKNAQTTAQLHSSHVLVK